MQPISNLHQWDLSPAQAKQLQKTLAGQVRLQPMRKQPRCVAGLDCALNKAQTAIYAAAAVFSFPDLKPLETAVARLPLVFPYVPGLLSFREIPVYLEVIKKLQNPVDLFLIDGQGIAHPRRLGLASHLGLFLNTPTIGCAKSRLIGTFDTPPLLKGHFSWLYDGADKIGAVLRTRSGTKPLFVSPGHLCSFQDAVDYTLACCTKYRLPEPARLAHQAASNAKTSAAF